MCNQGNLFDVFGISSKQTLVRGWSLIHAGFLFPYGFRSHMVTTELTAIPCRARELRLSSHSSVLRLSGKILASGEQLIYACRSRRLSHGIFVPTSR